MTGTAKEIKSTLGKEGKGTFDQLINGIEKGLDKGGKSEAMNASAGLRELKKNNEQSVSAFCIKLEGLSKRAYRGIAAESLSFMRADLLLHQLISWEHSIALTTAMDDAKPGEEYDDVKATALRLERNKALRDTIRKSNEVVV